MGGKGVTDGVRRGRSADHRFFLVFVKKVFNRIDTEAVSELVNEDCIVFGRQGVAQRKPVFQFSDDFLGRDAKKPFFFPFSMDEKRLGFGVVVFQIQIPDLTDPKAKAVKQLQDDSVTDADGFAEGTVQMVVFCCGELFISRKEKSITQSTVVMAFHKALDMEGKVKGPKKLGRFGASYLYPLFIKLGVIPRKQV